MVLSECSPAKMYVSHGLVQHSLSLLDPNIFNHTEVLLRSQWWVRPAWTNCESLAGPADRGCDGNVVLLRDRNTIGEKDVNDYAPLSRDIGLDQSSRHRGLPKRLEESIEGWKYKERNCRHSGKLMAEAVPGVSEKLW